MSAPSAAACRRTGSANLRSGYGGRNQPKKGATEYDSVISWGPPRDKLALGRAARSVPRVDFRRQPMRHELSSLPALTLWVALLGPASAQTSFKLNAPINVPGIVEGDVREMRMAPDGRHVVYLADQDEEEVVELYSVPLDPSGPAVKLNDPLTGRGMVRRFQISPDGQRVIFHVDPEGDFVLRIFSAPIDGSAPAVRLGPNGSFQST